MSEGSSQHPDRDAQFAYLNDQAAAHLAAGDPVISVDAKKKENIGEFRNGGREWQPKGSPEPVNVHDFIDKELGKVTPYGIYDVAANAGWVSVGTDHDTAAFAVTTIARWWQAVGQPAYPAAAGLLICADGGGSTATAPGCGRPSSPPSPQHRPGHHRLPPPARNQQVEQIEHRLFSHISMNWRGRPDQPRGRRPDHRRDHNPHRPYRPGRT